MTKKALLVILLFVFVPIVHAYQYNGAYNYGGENGGNIRFGSTFVASHQNWRQGLIRFHDFTWGSRNYGVLGFDADAGVNVTITCVTHDSITILIEPNVTSRVATHVYYDGKSRPSHYDGADQVIYDDGTDITTVYTQGGDREIELEWRYGSEYINIRNLCYISLGIFNLGILVFAAMMLSRGEFDGKAMINIIMATMAYNLIILSIAQYL